MLELNKIYCGDCLEVMKDIDDNSIDMILCDLPYGLTACKWDSSLNLDILWGQYNRIIKSHGAIVLTACQPFTSILVTSNIKNYKHCWVWNKVKPSGHLRAKIRPMLYAEDILVFTSSGESVRYFPVMTRQTPRMKRTYLKEVDGVLYSSECYGKERYHESLLTEKYPNQIISVSNANQSNRVVPTQKPVKLFEYLVRTYTHEGDLVLDNCAGSGTTGIACINTDRKFILIEKDETYYEVAKRRISDHAKVESTKTSILDFA